MNLKIYQVDAFTDKIFGGNPAAVCPLEQWLPDVLLQQIATENNLSETAFYIKKDDEYHIRWFTPNIEVDLCGHATLATAFVLFHFENHISSEIHFYSERSGKLTVRRQGDWLTLNFPTDTLERISLNEELSACFDVQAQEVYKGKTDYMLVFDSEAQIRNIQADFRKVGALPVRGVIVTAKGEQCDFVSRFFGPQSGVDEDPVTGSAHTTLIPYWTKKLGKTEMSAMQLSSRVGYLRCKYLNERVEISGQARAYMKGEISLNEELCVINDEPA